jgi:hypothetical protein
MDKIEDFTKKSCAHDDKKSARNENKSKIKAKMISQDEIPSINSEDVSRHIEP